MSGRYRPAKGNGSFDWKGDRRFHFSGTRPRRHSLGFRRSTWARLLYILRPLIVIFIIYEVCRFRNPAELVFGSQKKNSAAHLPRTQYPHNIPLHWPQSHAPLFPQHQKHQQEQQPDAQRPEQKQTIYEQPPPKGSEEKAPAQQQYPLSQPVEKASEEKQSVQKQPEQKQFTQQQPTPNLPEQKQQVQNQPLQQQQAQNLPVQKQPVQQQQVQNQAPQKQPEQKQPVHQQQSPNQPPQNQLVQKPHVRKVVKKVIKIIHKVPAQKPSTPKGSKNGPKPPPGISKTPLVGTAIWEDYNFLDRYYGGMRSVTSVNQMPEYPHGDAHPQIAVDIQLNSGLPSPQIDNPYPDYTSQAYKEQFGEVERCFLDAKDRIPVPRIRSFKGSVQGFPDPVIGSYQAIGLNGNKCYDRHSRFGPYGYGYSKPEGGTGAGIFDDQEGATQSWPITSRINYMPINWGVAQQRCFEKNQHRFLVAPNTTDEERQSFTWAKDQEDPRKHAPPKNRTPQTAVVLRIWQGFEWKQETILHMRAMISELSLLSGGEYRIYFLIQVKDNTLPIWSSKEIYNKVLAAALPKEFREMGVLWSEKQMELVYNGLPDSTVVGKKTYSVQRSAHLPLQYFAHTHPELDYFWNWEIDIRSTGHWYEMFDSLRKFARAQPRKGLWERNERFYVPSVHGNWSEFISNVRDTTDRPFDDDEEPLAPPIWGPHGATETKRFPEDPVPPRSHEMDEYEWGVGEEADLITLNPLFNPVGSGWVFRNDVTGYKLKNDHPPRRISIITASRLSRSLLQTMHKETALYHRSMFDEMWPATVALHHGLKAVYAPHPVYDERAWPPTMLETVLNSGPNGESGSSVDSPFNVFNEHNFRGVSWYYNALFSSDLWRRWWGFSVDQERGTHHEPKGEGRMCLPPMLLHPIKGFGLTAEEG